MSFTSDAIDLEKLKAALGGKTLEEARARQQKIMQFSDELIAFALNSDGKPHDFTSAEISIALTAAATKLLVRNSNVPEEIAQMIALANKVMQHVAFEEFEKKMDATAAIAAACGVPVNDDNPTDSTKAVVKKPDSELGTPGGSFSGRRRHELDIRS